MYVRAAVRDSSKPTGAEETPYARPGLCMPAPAVTDDPGGAELSSTSATAAAVAAASTESDRVVLPIALPTNASNSKPTAKPHDCAPDLFVGACTASASHRPLPQGPTPAPRRKRPLCSPAHGSSPVHKPVPKQPRCEACQMESHVASSPILTRPSKCLKCGSTASLPSLPPFPMGCDSSGPTPAPAPSDALSMPRAVDPQMESPCMPGSSLSGSVCADVDASASEWRRFTPGVINLTLCLGRIWSNGKGGQCGMKIATPLSSMF
jgi:hypothetical protein